MKKSTSSEKSLKKSIISETLRLQKIYDICFARINAVLEEKIRENGSNMKTFLPKDYKNNLNKKSNECRKETTRSTLPQVSSSSRSNARNNG
jgi:hypothetical protein